MFTLRAWCGTALAFALSLTLPVARADMITPASIPNPPSSVGSANYAPIYSPGDVVTTQYKSLGLNFSTGSAMATAITSLNGVSVWAPAALVAQPAIQVAGSPPVNYPVAEIYYGGRWSGASLVLPGTLTPAETSSVTMEIIGRGVGVSFYNPNGGLLGTATAGGIGPHGGQLYTFTGSDIRSFDVFAPIIDPIPNAPPPNPAWGVAEISFGTLHAPEPSSFVLAGLGVLGLAARFGWRRLRPPT